MKLKEEIQSVQTIYPMKEKVVDGKTGIFIGCPDCNTGRTYLIDKTIMAILEGEESLSIYIVCESCNKRILVGIGRVSGEEGFSYSKPTYLRQRTKMEIKDNNGLGKLK